MNEEEQIQEEKEAVASMRLAQSNMTKAIERIKRLEYRLGQAADRLGEVKRYVGDSAHVYPINNKAQRVSELFADYEAEARKDL